MIDKFQTLLNFIQKPTFQAPIVICCIALAFFSVHQHADTMRIGYKLSAAKHQEDQLIDQKRILELGIAKLLQNKNIETLAKNQFSLLRPNAEQTVYVISGTQPHALTIAMLD